MFVKRLLQFLRQLHVVASRVETETTTTIVSGKMTPEQQKAFDDAFASMDDAMKKMCRAFDMVKR